MNNPFRTTSNPFKNREYHNENKYYSDKPKNTFISNTFISNKSKIFSFTEEQFPEMSNKNTILTNSNVNFIDAINTKNLEKKETVIEPGWVQIRVNKKTGQIETKYGKRSKRKPIKNNDIYDLDLADDNINYQMFIIIDKLNENWTRYKQQYDEINGDGSYDDRFYYEIYDDELDDDIESEEAESEEDDFY